MRTGWWKFTWTSTSENKITELNDHDLEHIAEYIKDGYIEGEILQEEEE